MYATMNDSNVAVLPVPDGISSKQWPYKEFQVSDLQMEDKIRTVDFWDSITLASRVRLSSNMYSYCSG